MQSANEALADRARIHSVDLLRYEAGVRRDILKQLERLERDLIDRLRLAGVEGTQDGLTVFQRQRIDLLLTSVTETIRTAYRGMDTSMADELADLAVIESEWVARGLNVGLGVETLTVLPTPSLLRAAASDAVILGAPSREWWSRQAGDLVERFSDEVRQGVIAGEPNSKIVQRVRGTRAAGYRNGIMSVTRRHAEALVRSSVQAISTEARLLTMQENSDVVKGMEQLSTLDSKTSDICIAYAGKAWDLEGKPIGHKLPFNGGTPRHFNCRSTMVPILKSFRELGVNRDEIPVGSRASLDGQVPADLSFQEFLSGKSEAFQVDLLGAGRAELWRSGKISLTDLVDQRGRPLSLEQLRERV